MRDLFFNEIVTEQDIANNILVELSNLPKHDLQASADTKMGYSIDSDTVFLDSASSSFYGSGIYVIYRYNIPFYVGKTETSIRNRISRFVKEVNAKSRFDERHPAGNKWRHYYGRGNFDGAKVAAVAMEFEKCCSNKVEEYLIARLQPIGNRKALFK